ncbi:hypothetical protein AMS68_003852 [Peltaster fructicola]|uniref:Peptidase A1 domain-containing protein n=1 Tax=Peltaster fructicola TaxID=286661 RepID=A0A6H0XUK7_9PEZI|nr:hypothetical protein AMS68_003852 [Peltaster fructicola]
MRYTTALLSLAASASAFPTIVSRAVDDVLTPAPLCERFDVAFTVDGNYQSANAVKNGTSAELVLEAERLSVYPGTQAYFNDSNPSPTEGFDYKALNFVLDDGVYGAFAADVGDSYGLAVPIYLVKDKQQFEWLSFNGSIGHKLFAAPNSLYACFRSLVDAPPNFFLSFGDYNFSSSIAGPPAGCNITNVVQNYNVEGGLQPSS